MADRESNTPLGPTSPDLGWSLSVILRKWHERVEQALADVPHGTRGYEILTVISQNEPPTQSGLAKHLNIDKTVMPYVLDSLESAGLLERRIDPQDRRARRITITPRGESVLSELHTAVREAEQSALDSVPAKVRVAFIDQAEHLALAINAAPPTDACSDSIDGLAVAQGAESA
ncbi:MarR family transcriptional regulator for hemolysin [Microbacteriaceae bacterium SG_E_30_P1]|uniref:MarR family transcriptional regulator for hemolysin n=1 Tax=Antiquaquibacter oligotrophicus TaxID=2880260 RepID=A0ABT6KM04_9MICO|nr:MarR family transcriptional regulator [Antiquaquibacter oligotrophicus]MDH6180776.1 MarR family transcriptional regulator for hemolysin [Antiquaquibacter oligotrophicus]UDF13505.1 MarR family transcriptional regulator [Antiquaquibacter oligotrophicus]